MARYTYFCASYWHHNCEPSSVAVALQSPKWGTTSAKLGDAYNAVRRAIESTMEEETDFCTDVPEDEFVEPDLCWPGVNPESASALFTPKELMAHRRDLLQGQVVWLERG